MRNISDTIGRLSAFRVPSGLSDNASTDRLAELADFGSNPGSLRGRCYIPVDLPADAPLVVVLHGCTQNASGYDHGAGWSELANARGFAVLFPEQQRGNNANLCFNWFQPDDIRRDHGEALSIRQMVGAMLARHDCDPARVFVTGLSAGGAMTAVMLATYPEIFAGGAVIAGLPYGSAITMPAAFDRMRGSGGPDTETLAALVRGASDHAGPWPTLSVWHGRADRTVDESNAALILDQWRALHGLPLEPTRTEMIDGHPRRTWCGPNSKPLIEDYLIAGMGHGTPLDPASAAGGGESGPYMLDVGIASTRHIADFWGIADIRVDGAKPHSQSKTVTSAGVKQGSPRPVTNSVGQVIEDALRSAGLMR